MMYKLFRNAEGKVFLDMSYDKQDIIDTLGSYIECFLTIDYSVYENKDGKDTKIADIKSIDDYVNFKYSNPLKRERKIK